MPNPFTKQANGLWKDNPELRRLYSSDVRSQLESGLENRMVREFLPYFAQQLPQQMGLYDRVRMTVNPYIARFLNWAGVKNHGFNTQKGYYARQAVNNRLQQSAGHAPYTPQQIERILGPASRWNDVDNPFARARAAFNNPSSPPYQRFQQYAPSMVNWKEAERAIDQTANAEGGHSVVAGQLHRQPDMINPYINRL